MSLKESNNPNQRSWMTQHVVMTAERMTQRSCDDTGGDDHSVDDPPRSGHRTCSSSIVNRHQTKFVITQSV